MGQVSSFLPVNNGQANLRPKRNSHEPLALLGLPASLVDVLRFAILHPDEPIYLRRLEQFFGARSASFQRDLHRLEALGALAKVPRDSADARRVSYAVVRNWPLWPAMRKLMAELSDPIVLVQEALRGIAGVEAAFVYGSQASGRARPDSDLDVFVFGDAVDARAMRRSLAELSILLGREVNPSVYSRLRLAERLSADDGGSRRFLKDILTGPKAWVAGAAAAIAPTAIAAGIAAAAFAQINPIAG
jgi:predicted nucleotidyltransferase